MNLIEIPIVKTSYNSAIVEAYINQSEKLSTFYPNGFGLDGIIKNAKEKWLDVEKREILIEVIQSQYAQSNIDIKGSLVEKNIKLLTSQNTFTITAGQQIHAYLGPMFVAFKLLSAAAVAEACNAKDQSNNYVPVFWMATEDHDFEEVSTVKLFGETFTWQKSINLLSAVGKLPTDGLELMGDQMIAKFQNDPDTAEVITTMQKIYGECTNFADATRKILHYYFQSTGIVILDANDALLKKIFTPIIEQEIENPKPELIDKYTKQLEDNGFKKQISARESNLFLFINENRERLQINGDNYKTAISEQLFTKAELHQLLKTNPEAFSPNVALRPLYQEYILPNVAYISGGSEMVYWFQIKGLFEYYQINYPNVWLRKSGIILSNKIAESITKAGLTIEDMFLLDKELTDKITHSIGTTNAELFQVLEAMHENFDLLEQKYRQSNLFNKNTLESLKVLKSNIIQLTKKIEEEKEELIAQSPLFSKVLKIQDNYFKNKQERDLPLLLQLKNTPLFKSEHLYNYYIFNTNLLLYLA